MRSSRRHPPSPAELRNRRSTRWIALAAVAGVLFIAAAVSAFALAIGLNPPLDDELCPRERAAAAEVVVLLDTTDPWNVTQRTVVHNEFARLQASLPRFARLHLYTLDEELDAAPRPVLRLCNPGEVDDFGSVPVIGRASAWLFSNPSQLRRWRGDFVSASDSILAAIAAGDDVANRSPIFETTRAIALRVFEQAGEDAPRSIYFFSDMLQHSPAYSHYRNGEWRVEDAYALADIGATGSRALDGAEVHIFLIDRGLAGPGRGPLALSLFWEAYFNRQGATVERVRRVEG